MIVMMCFFKESPEEIKKRREVEKILNEKEDENDLFDKLLDNIKNLNESKKINKSKRVLKTRKGKLK